MHRHRALIVLARYWPRIVAALLITLVFSPAPLRAQIPGDSIPSSTYFRAFSGYHAGAYRDTLGVYQGELRSSIRTATSRWIDSICYQTMCGECLYQMGQLPEALDQYNGALSTYLAFSNWMMRVQFPQTIDSAGAHPIFPWGQSSRNSVVGKFPEKITMGQGQLDNSGVVQRGGVVQNPILFPVHVAEIARATTLAMRRRHELMGPLCKHDRLTKQLADTLGRRPGVAHNWSEAWIEVQLGIAQHAAGATAQAVPILQHSLITLGEYDHQFTGVALLELGRIALEAGNFDAAAQFFLEASYAAATFSDITTVEEALRYGAITHLAANQKGLYPPLVPAAAWAKKNGYDQLYVSLLTMAGENLVAIGETARAASLLADARVATTRNDLAAASVGARLNHATAMAAYQAGSSKAGDQAMAAALKFQQGSSLWLFHIAQADGRYQSGDSDISGRVAALLYQSVLRDPTPADWSLNPLECLSVLSVPHLAPFEHWFLLAWKEGNNRDAALEISDRIRRHRFYSTLPLGGRVLALRWILEGPEEGLDKQAALQKQELLGRYPDYEKLQREARELRTKLTQNPLTDLSADAKKEQAKQLTALAAIAQQQELMLEAIAVRRDASELVFPPLRTARDIQASLPPGHAILSLIATSPASGGNLFAFMYSRDKYAQWQIASPKLIERQVTTLLRDLGNFDPNHPVSLADVEKGVWRKSAAKTLDLLLEGSNVDLTSNFSELAIVPDGFLWYLPFEALPVGGADKGVPLIAKARIRYAPTVSLATPFVETRKPRPNIAVVLGRLYPKDSEETSQAAFERIARVAPGAVSLTGAPTANAPVYRSLFDGLIVLDDIKSDRGPYDWILGQADHRKTAGATLRDAMFLPWGGPTQIMLPGFHTPAESALRKSDKAGGDIFLSLCGLMSTGAKTVLISRWRVGGQTSFDLLREFAQELPHTSAAASWQRSVLLARDAQLDPAREPRFKHPGVETEPPKAEHPFFWAGYLMADRGGLAPGEETPPAPQPAPPPAPAAEDSAKPPAAVPGAPSPPEIAPALDLDKKKSTTEKGKKSPKPAPPKKKPTKPAEKEDS